MTTVFIDGLPYEADPKQNMLQTILSLGLDLPYFCWHPAMDSVGACRQCAVKQFKDENDTRGRIVMACMTAATEGLRISIQDPEAKKVRESAIEWLMVNHPHDCPVCDEGGECHLQDMTVITGHVYRRYRFEKRTHRNQYLGPFINHEMNRCIQCYRCVRFYRDYAGGQDFNVFSAHDSVYFGRHTDGVLESEFSGNLVEMCPTGVFTDKSFRQHFIRKWDLQTAPSICVHCGLGCNTTPGERSGLLRRIRNRYNQEVNGYFLCDRGRYGYEFVNSPSRIRKPLVKNRDQADATPTDHQGALQRLSEILEKAPSLIGIGSPRASLESNYSLRKLVGNDHFFAGVSAREAHLLDSVLQIMKDGSVPPASLHEAAMSDAVLVLGEDLNNTAPMLALTLRQSIRNQPRENAQRLKIDPFMDSSIRQVTQGQQGPLYLVNVSDTRLDDAATQIIHLAPDDIARLGFQIAHLVDTAAPAVSGLSEESGSLAAEIAEKLKEAKRPLIISGTSLGNTAVLQAAANVAQALQAVGKDVKLTYAVPESNSMGLAMLGKGDLDKALDLVKQTPDTVLIILENDLFRRADEQIVQELIHSAASVIALDTLENSTTAMADLVLPAATFAEADGTLVNNEGRAQRFYQVISPQKEVQESWRWINEMMQIRQNDLSDHWQNLDDVVKALVHENPLFEMVTQLAPTADFRIHDQKIPRQPHRFSGRTAMNANISVHEPKPPDDPDTPYAFSMEGYKGELPSALTPRYWAPGWNSVQSLNKFQEEVGGPLRGGDPGQHLIHPAEVTGQGYFQEIPERFAPRDEEYLVLPIYHIYGSEELSRQSPPVAELSGGPAVVIPADLAGKLGIDNGQTVQFVLGERRIHLPARILTSLPGGVIGLPAGYPGVPAQIPAWGKLELDQPGKES